jgi:peptidoglycan DL-endopeptidase CwlO
LLSQFAQGVLAQQASDPTLNIDTAVASSLSSLLSANSGPLYTATGQLQQFAGALLLTPGTSAANTDAQTLQALADAALPASAATTSPATTGSAQQLQEAADAARQAFLASQLTALDTASTDTSTQTQTVAATNTATGTTSTAVSAATATADLRAANLASAIAPAATDTDTADTTTNTTAATTTPVTNPTLAPTPAAVATSAADLLPTTGDVRDPYQQAALASGQSVFGKELNSFVPGTAEAEFPAAVRALSAVRPVVPRRDEAETATNAPA